MSIREKVKPNVLYIATLSFLAFMTIGGILIWGALSGEFKHEIQLILSAALGASGTAFLALGSQVATNDPPNHVKEVLSTVEKLSNRLIDMMSKK